MSTTVTYKGSILTTVNNNTKTLKTAGKYMEGDVILTDASGGTDAVSVVDTIDSHGGTIREITALDISDTTAVASDVAQGKYFYTSAGVKTLGTGTGGGGGGSVTQDQDGYIVLPSTGGGGGGSVLIQKSITLNGAYDATDDNADGYSEVTVNVQGGASVSETQGTYGTEVVVTSGNAPSATSHTIYFEFTDETDETIIGYWNGTFISDAVTATTPTTYDSKTVALAQLDGVTWYSYTPPTPGQWETVFTGNISPNADTPYNYFWIDSLSNVYPVDGSVWRITVDNTEYICTAATASINAGNYVCIGNPKYSGGTDNSSSAPFNFSNAGWGAWVGDTELISDGVTVYTVKIEQQVE